MRFDRDKFRRELNQCGRILKDWLADSWVLSQIVPEDTNRRFLCGTRFHIKEWRQTRCHGAADILFLFVWSISIVFIFFYESATTALKFLFWMLISAILLTIGAISCFQTKK